MSGITLAQAETQLALWIDADTAVATGQSYSIAGRTLTRADARAIAERIDYWNNWVKRLANGGISYRGVTPII